MSVSKEILIKQLSDFNDTDKYTPSDLLDFLFQCKLLKIFTESSINKFQAYLDKNRAVIIKYLEESPLFQQIYSEEELLIVNDIRKNHLDTFWAMCESCKQQVKDELIAAAIIVKSLNKEQIISLIDFLVKYVICTDKKIIQNMKYKLQYFEETNTFTINQMPLNLSPNESDTLKNICFVQINKQSHIYSVDVCRVNEKANALINQNIIARKKKNSPYRLMENITFCD